MKRILLMAAFMMTAGFVLNAQSDAKSCNKPCTHEEKASAQVDNGASKAVLAANNDESIEMKTCEQSGNVSFYRKDVCENSGKVSYTEVEYQDASGTFVAKAASDVEPAKAAPAEKSSCNSKSSKSCCSSKASKTSAMHPNAGNCSSSAKKSCGEKS